MANTMQDVLNTMNPEDTNTTSQNTNKSNLDFINKIISYFTKDP